MHLSQLAVGGISVNGLCALTIVTVHRNGGVWRQVFSRGRSVVDLIRVGDTSCSGTEIELHLDPEIFSDAQVDTVELRRHMHEIACLNPGLEFALQGELLVELEGLAALLRERGTGPVFEAKGQRDGVDVHVCVRWGGEEEYHRGFCNQVYLDSDDTAAITRALRSTRPEGRSTIVSLMMQEPRFGGPTRGRLDSPEAEAAIESVVANCLPEFLAEHPEYAAG